MKILNFFILLFLLHSTRVWSQDSLKSSIILMKAMNDEVSRNLEHLHEDGYDKPFFIAYSLSDIQFSYSMATLGAVLSSAGTRARSWNTRVIVGDYHLNDENFNNSFQSSSFDPGYEPVPLEDDYWGIRRVFWIATNNIYKSAARNYAQKIKTLEENNQEYPLPDFSRESEVKYYDTAVIRRPGLASLEQLSKDISAKFKEYPSFINSGAYVGNTSSVNYFLNSEGTEAQFPTTITSVFIDASALGIRKIPKAGNLQYLASSFDNLPSVEMIHKDIEVLAKSILESGDAKDLEDDYSGPVLLEGQAVAEFFIANLLNNGDEGLIASRKELVNNSKKAVEKHFDELKKEIEKGSETKIASGSISVKAAPFLKTFQGNTLLGSFAIDGEGVVPVEELVLVEDGVLKTKLNGRTPSVNVAKSNGYKRLQVSSSSTSYTTAPGVLLITSDKAISTDSLRAIFLEEIKQEELDFGITISPLEVHASTKPLQYKTMGIKDQTQELLNVAFVNYKKKNAMKKIVAVSNELIVHNFIYKGSAGWMGSNIFSDGVPVSMVVPAAIILKDFDVKAFKGNEDLYEPTIKGPHDNQ